MPTELNILRTDDPEVDSFKCLQNVNLTLRSFNDPRTPVDRVISRSIYDTANVAFVTSVNFEGVREPVFPHYVDDVVAAQNEDGTWGDYIVQNPYDLALSTVTALKLVAYKMYSRPELEQNLMRGLCSLPKLLESLQTSNAYATVGFELLFPAHLDGLFHQLGTRLATDKSFLQDQVISEGLLAMLDYVAKLNVYTEKKLARVLDHDLIYKQPNTLQHSIEFAMRINLPIDDTVRGEADPGTAASRVDWEKLRKLQDRGGAFGNSAAATAAFYMNTGDKRALASLYRHAESGQPVNYPMSTFELLWSADIAERTGLLNYLPGRKSEILNTIGSQWSPEGVSWSPDFDVYDLDDTAAAFILLRRNGIQVDPKVFKRFQKDGEMFCFPGELQGSPTHLLHFVEIFNYFDMKELSGADRALFQTMRKNAINDALDAIREKGFADKWHLSDFYTMAIGIDALLSIGDEDIDKSRNSLSGLSAQQIKDEVVSYLLGTQSPENGGWGRHPAENIEETAWACFSIIKLLKQTSKLSQDDLYILYESLTQGKAYLQREATKQRQVPNLWIDKVLYTPKRIVSVLVNSVLAHEALDAVAV